MKIYITFFISSLQCTKPLQKNCQSEELSLPIAMVNHLACIKANFSSKDTLRNIKKKLQMNLLIFTFFLLLLYR